MKEIVSIHIGGTGIRVGESFWNGQCLENAVNLSGQFIKGDLPEGNDGTTISTYFQEQSSGKFTPRALFCDLCADVCDDLRSFEFKGFIPQENIISGIKDCGDFANAFNTEGQTIIQSVEDRLKKIVEGCDSLEGFQIFSSLIGGTGSGFASKLMSCLTKNYDNKTILGVHSCPSTDFSTNPFEWYNVVFSYTHLLEKEHLTLLTQNTPLLEISEKYYGIDQPTFYDINNLIAEAASFYNCSSKSSFVNLNGTVNSLTNLNTKLHFCVPSLIASDSKDFEELTSQAVNYSNLFASIKSNKILNSHLSFRGNDVPSDNDINSLSKLFLNSKNKVTTSSNNRVPIVNAELEENYNQVTHVVNDTGIADLFKKFSDNFSVLYNTRAYVSGFIATGMEEALFAEYLYNFQEMTREYEKI